jgi:hypothetical protein
MVGMAKESTICSTVVAMMGPGSADYGDTMVSS